MSFRNQWLKLNTKFNIYLFIHLSFEGILFRSTGTEKNKHLKIFTSLSFPHHTRNLFTQITLNKINTVSIINTVLY